MKRLRLLYLLPAERFGGAERQGLYHLEELPRHGVDVHAVVGPGRPLLDALRGSNVPHEPFEHFPDRTPRISSVAFGLQYFQRWLASIVRSAARICDRVGQERFDLVFANRTVAWLVAAVVSTRLGVPYVLRAGSRPAHRWLAPGLDVLDRAARPEAVFSNCRAVDRAIASHFHAPRYLLPNAVDELKFAPGSSKLARTRLGLPEGVPLVGLAARPAPEKGFDVFGRAAARMHALRPDACFVVAGDFGFRAQYESELRRAGLGEAVRFLGHVDAMPDFFRAVDVVLLTSRAASIEASPNALLEAMATARPVVATAVGGVPELIDDGREGYLVADGDDVGLADRVVELLGAPARRLELGRAGRKRALSRHRVSVVVARLARDLYGIRSLRTHDPSYEGIRGLVPRGA